MGDQRRYRSPSNRHERTKSPRLGRHDKANGSPLAFSQPTEEADEVPAVGDEVLGTGIVYGVCRCATRIPNATFNAAGSPDAVAR